MWDIPQSCHCVNCIELSNVIGYSNVYTEYGYLLQTRINKCIDSAINGGFIKY